MKKVALRVFLLMIILGAGFLFNRYGLLQRTLDWIQNFGPLGPVIFILVYSLSCVFFVPSFIFTFSSGALFGFLPGAGLSLLGNASGSLCAFLIGRYLARGWVEKRFAHNTEFQRLAGAVEKKGWKVLILARFSPVFPFLVGNYAFGVTRISAAHYFFGTLLGSIPSALLYAYFGFLTGDFASFQNSARARTPQEWAVLGLGLAATIFLAWYLRRIAEKTGNS